MADANLLEILSMESRLDDMVVYGNVRCAISKPSFLAKKIGVVDGFFALVDVLALKCNGVDYFSKFSNYQDSKHIYFSKGSIVVVINDKDLIGKNVRVYGRSMKGCTIKKQKTSNYRDGVAAFVWSKGRDGNWQIAPNKVQPFGVSDAKGTVLEDYLVSLVGGGDFSFVHPESINGIQEYEGVLDAEVLELDKVEGAIEYSTDYVDLTKVPLNLVHRLEASEVSGHADAVGDAINSLEALAKDYAKDLVRDIKDRAYYENTDSADESLVNSSEVAHQIVDNFVNKIASKYNSNISSNVKVKGREFVDDIVDSVINCVSYRSTDDEKEGRSSLSDSLELFKEIENLKKNVAIDYTLMGLYNSNVPAFRDVFQYAGRVIGSVTGIGIEEIISNHNTMTRYNDMTTDEWFWCLIKNPYLCGLMGSNLNIWDCDRIFLGFSKFDNYEECIETRNMLKMLDSLKTSSDRSTLISRSLAMKVDDNYPSYGKRYLSISGLPFKKENAVAVNLIGVNSLSPEFANEIINKPFSPKIAISHLNSIGMVEEVNDGIILTKDLKKEYIIYTKLIEKGHKLTGIDDEGIACTIDNFEAEKGFQLEKLQKDGIQLVKYEAGVLSGCAGSGKTTTSDCMVMAIEEYLPHYKLRFGAPTGKAARRLAEVVGGNVKTIHSMFGLGLGEEPYIRSKDKFRRKNDEGVKYAYFLDEMAMCNMNLMYEIVDHLNDSDLVYFLGDIKQLSPIGKGSPFRALMAFLPCVELGVSKRAAENGKINYNVGLINFLSDDKVVELQEGSDFEIIGCADIEIQKTVVSVFERYLQEFDEDDIQVVTGYNTDKYPWSTVNLNPLLQGLLRKPSELLYVYNDQNFYRNDRVIHVKRNAYEMPRYERVEGTNTFKELPTFGVVNGELGKIVGAVRSDIITVVPWEDNYTSEEWEEMSEDERKVVETRRETSVEIRDDSEIKDENTYFILVQVYDVDLMKDVLVFYRANYRDELASDFHTRVFTGGDLRYLELAYALTTHKMQGSQSPAIIIPLGASGSVQFMNRNMLNTMITRAQEKVCLIGSVIGKNSALTNGRRITNINDGDDVLGLLC